MAVPDAASHNRIVLSSEPETMRVPSGENATDLTIEDVHERHAELPAIFLVVLLPPRVCLDTAASNAVAEMVPKGRMATPTGKYVEHSERWGSQTSRRISAHPKYRVPAPGCISVRIKDQSCSTLH